MFSGGACYISGAKVAKSLQNLAHQQRRLVVLTKSQEQKLQNLAHQQKTKTHAPPENVLS
jgi:predicted butyrate kinase (DUF1464 family)